MEVVVVVHSTQHTNNDDQRGKKNQTFNNLLQGCSLKHPGIRQDTMVIVAPGAFTNPWSESTIPRILVFCQME